MPPDDIDEYLSTVEEPKRRTLEALRRTIRELIPQATEAISYGLPAFQVEGKTVAGFAAFSNHLSYLPHSGSVLSKVGDDIRGYTYTKSSLHFPIDQPLPRELVARLLRLRLAEAGIATSAE